MKRAVFEKDFIRVEDSETGTPGAFLKFAFRVQAALYKLRYRFVHVKPQDKKYNVAVCAIFKNEAPYLKEWIEFNHLVGVEHFYLYNNNSVCAERSRHTDPVSLRAGANEVLQGLH